MKFGFIVFEKIPFSSLALLCGTKKTIRPSELIELIQVKCDKSKNKFSKVKLNDILPCLRKQTST